MVPSGIGGGGAGQNLAPLLSHGERSIFSNRCVGFRDESRHVLGMSTRSASNQSGSCSTLRQNSRAWQFYVNRRGLSVVQTADPEPIQHQSGWRANSLTAILAFIVFLVGFGGRSFGLWLVAWGVLAAPFDPVWPVEFLLAGPLALIALTSAVILRRRSRPSRLISLAIVLSIVTLLWSSLCGYFVLEFDGDSV